MIIMDSIQMAQMVADLSDLEAARKERARAIVQANREIEQAAEAATVSATTMASTASASATATASASASTTPNTTPPDRPALHRRVTSSSSVLAATGGTATPFDSYLGRFLSPALTRTNSASNVNAQTSTTDSLAALSELRTKLKQYNDSTSLRQARDKVAALAGSGSAGAGAGAGTAGAGSAGAGSASAPAQTPAPMPAYSFPRE